MLLLTLKKDRIKQLSQEKEKIKIQSKLIK